MPPRTLTTRRLNRALLARQHLLRRSRSSIPAVLESIGGLQTQYAPSGYIGLWSRRDLPRRGSLTTSLVRRQVVQATLMRSTIHMVSARDYPLLAAGVRSARRDWWMRIARARHLDRFDLDVVTGILRSELEHGPRTRKELIGALEASGFPAQIWEGAGLWVDLVRVPPSGTWERRRADLYGLAERWIRAPSIPEHEGLVHLITRYLGGFGPASIQDISSWAGVGVPAIQETLERVTLRGFESDNGMQLVDLPRAPIPDGSVEAPVRFLPTWDATLLVHARRARILPEEYRSMVFRTKNPHSVGTFLVDGSVAGSWSLTGGSVELNPFERLSAKVRSQVESEAERLTAFHRE